MMHAGYFLTGRTCRSEGRRFGALDIAIPMLSPAELELTIETLRRNSHVLATMPLGELTRRLSLPVEAWLDRSNPFRVEAERLLPLVTGYSETMVRQGLDLHFQALRGDAIEELLTAELGALRVAAPEGGAVIGHILSGNIPGLGIAPLLLTFASRAAALLKSAAGDPLLPALFAESLATIDPELGTCVASLYWPGGDSGLESVALRHCDLVVASGSSAAIAALAGRTSRPFIGHGHKVSFAAVDRSVLQNVATAAELADQLAYDMSMWDQQGCLSPQLCYVEDGGSVSITEFAQLLGAALDRWLVRLPPRRLDLSEKSEVARFRQAAEWNDTVSLLRSDTECWSVFIEERPDFGGSCLNRNLRLKSVTSLDQLEPILTPHARQLEACGLAAPPERHAHLEAMLARCGVHRVCAIGEMQRPDLSWKQGGRPRIAEWIAILTSDSRSPMRERRD